MVCELELGVGSGGRKLMKNDAFSGFTMFL